MGFWFIPLIEMFQHHALGCHHGARDRAEIPAVVQEETTWSTLLRCENPAGAGLEKVSCQWAHRDARAQVEYTKMDTRQYTINNDAHHLTHRCFTTRVRCLPFLSRTCQLCGSRAIGRQRISTCSMQCVATQSEWELHAAFLAIDTWLPRLRGTTLCLFQSDSTAALYAVMHASGETPAMNALTAEIAFRLKCANVFKVPEHVAGTLNFDCVALSRLSEGAQLPAILGNVRRDVPKPRQPVFFWCLLRCL